MTGGILHVTVKLLGLAALFSRKVACVNFFTTPLSSQCINIGFAHERLCARQACISISFNLSLQGHTWHNFYAVLMF